ncbi:MAG: N-acetylglutamate synthase [Frankiales bacterium]|nr:N-acetylglutamate synthase [Frankiales bacterium]
MHQPRYTVALTAADVGERVMIRHALDVVEDGHSLSDVVGDLLAWDSGTLRIGTRSGVVAVAEAALVAGRRVPPSRLRRALDASVPEVQRMSALSWQALETERLGGWRLRAGAGFTGRANSVLPLGDPGLPLDLAIAHVERWYGDRGLRPRFQLPQPDSAALSTALGERGWEVVDSAEVLVGDVAQALELAGESPRDLAPVTITDAPSPGWLAGYHYRGGQLPAAGYTILTHHREPGFASVVEGGRVVAIARGAVDAGWLGVTAVEVAEPYRRRGLGRHVMIGLLRWGQTLGARHAHLQVAVDNQGGKGLYARIGFAFHHRYDYRVPQ